MRCRICKVQGTLFLLTLCPQPACLTHRHSQIEVRLVPSKSCWVALPPAYVARLLEGQSPIPLVLQLTSASGMSAFQDSCS